MKKDKYTLLQRKLTDWLLTLLLLLLTIGMAAWLTGNTVPLQTR